MNEKCLEKIHQEFGSVEGFLDKYSEPHILRELKAPITIQAPQKSMEQENPWNITPEMLNAELQHLYFDEPDSFFKNLCNLLNSGSNIILVGPPGTGKTEVALAVSKLAKKYVLGKDGICHVFSTATSDWTTFDTIGGYMPTKSNELEFKEGQFLRAIRDDKILVIDEINRAEIDKAFGQLFTVLSGQSVELQFLDANNLPIKLESSKEILNSFKKDNKYIIGSNWRILATMNTLDKAALYQMSYAFMRRFAFVHVDVPINKSECLKTINRQDNYDMDDALIQKIGILWDSISKSEQGKENPRQIGPAVFSSIIKLVKNSNVDPADEDKLDKILASAIIAFVLPQFEGATVETELKPLAKSLKKYEKHLARFFEEMFGEDFGNLTR
ncbi:AAA family ATPase [Candidatus Micrarchaeota archaeon]|nr:AAA family ATPase [Candidatus Micrarchaeota archaeon]